MARVVTVIEGERIETSTNLVSDDVCCVEIMQGCAAKEGGNDQFEDGTCIDGEVLCETCDLTFFTTTNFFTQANIDNGSPPKNVAGDELMTQLGAP